MRTLRREGQCGGCVGVVLAQHQHQTNIKQTIRSIYLLVVSIYLLITGRMSMTLADGNCEINGREGGRGQKSSARRGQSASQSATQFLIRRPLSLR